MMEASGFGFECLSPIERKLVTAQCLAFIDDTDLTEAAKSVDNTGEDICSSIQKAATLWAGGIRATGGAVNPDKSFWWFFDWQWDGIMVGGHSDQRTLLPQTSRSGSRVYQGSWNLSAAFHRPNRNGLWV